MSPCTESESPALATLVLLWGPFWIRGLPGTCRPQAENIRLSLISPIKGSKLLPSGKLRNKQKMLNWFIPQRAQSEEPDFLYLCYEEGCSPCKGTQLLFVSKILSVLGRTLPLGNAVTWIISDLTLALVSEFLFQTKFFLPLWLFL